MELRGLTAHSVLPTGRQPRMARWLAEGDVRTLCIGQKQFEGILRGRPETSLAVMRVLGDRLRERETAAH